MLMVYSYQWNFSTENVPREARERFSTDKSLECRVNNIFKRFFVILLKWKTMNEVCPNFQLEHFFSRRARVELLWQKMRQGDIWRVNFCIFWWFFEFSREGAAKFTHRLGPKLVKNFRTFGHDHTLFKLTARMAKQEFYFRGILKSNIKTFNEKRIYFIYLFVYVITLYFRSGSIRI